jgi:hypothetical protein
VRFGIVNGCGRCSCAGRWHRSVSCVFNSAFYGFAFDEEAIQTAAIDAFSADLVERTLCPLVSAQTLNPTCTYFLPRANVLQALIICAHPPLVVGRICRLLLAEPELVLLVRDEERLLDAAPHRVQRVA